jgi:hypothetical protein
MPDGVKSMLNGYRKLELERYVNGKDDEETLDWKMSIDCLCHNYPGLTKAEIVTDFVLFWKRTLGNNLNRDQSKRCSKARRAKNAAAAATRINEAGMN